jgi:hypothetical protein
MCIIHGGNDKIMEEKFNEICNYFICHLKCGFFEHKVLKNRWPHMWLIIDE